MFNSSNMKKFILVSLIGILMLIPGCSGLGNIILPEKEGTETVKIKKYSPGAYDSEDRPILVRKDPANQTMTFLNLDVDKEYTLSYNGTSCFYDKYGTALTAEQVSVGDVVDIHFISENKHLTNLQLSTEVWTASSVSRFHFASNNTQLSIGDEVYKLSSHVQYFSEGQPIEQRDINNVDVLSFQGIGNIIYSVSIDEGHGYLRLSGQEAFVGGWIEIGTSVICQITDNMLITVPVGNYEVRVTGNGNQVTKVVSIAKNKETLFDVSEFLPEKTEMGMMLFSVTPSEAEVYVDGDKVDISKPVPLSFGMHQLICRCDGYKTVTQYFTVLEETAGLNIVLEKVSESSSDILKPSGSSVSGNTVSGNDAGSVSGNSVSGNDSDNTLNDSENTVSGNDIDEKTDKSETSAAIKPSETTESNVNTTAYYKVYIDAPEELEVYLDGSYVGVSPCSFKKVSGTHEITLAKHGYITRSYTILIDEDERDINYSFVDLLPEEAEDESSNDDNSGVATKPVTDSSTGTDSSSGTDSSAGTEAGTGSDSDGSSTVVGTDNSVNSGSTTDTSADGGSTTTNTSADSGSTTTDTSADSGSATTDTSADSGSATTDTSADSGSATTDTSADGGSTATDASADSGNTATDATAAGNSEEGATGNAAGEASNGGSIGSENP